MSYPFRSCRGGRARKLSPSFRSASHSLHVAHAMQIGSRARTTVGSERSNLTGRHDELAGHELLALLHEHRRHLPDRIPVDEQSLELGLLLQRLGDLRNRIAADLDLLEPWSSGHLGRN